MTSQLARRPAGVQVLFPPGGGWALRLKKDLETAEFEAYIPVEEQMDRHERLRLLYVAATRARDHLVVSVHRKKGGTDSTAAEMFHATGWEPSLVDVFDLEGTDEHARAAPATEPAPVSLPSLADWERQHATALASGTRRLAVSATQLAKEAAGAEGVLGKEGIIEALCRSALDSDLVRRASARPHWREVYVGVPSGEGVLAGYVDLLYRDDDGLVVVGLQDRHLAHPGRARRQGGALPGPTGRVRPRRGRGDG